MHNISVNVFIFGIQGSVKDFQLWVSSRKDNAPYPLIGEFVINPENYDHNINLQTRKIFLISFFIIYRAVLSISTHQPL